MTRPSSGSSSSRCTEGGLRRAMLSCPKCSVPVGEMDLGVGILDVICAKCHFAYRFFYGKLAGRNSRQVTLQRQTTKQAGSYRREYELRLETPAGSLLTFDFSTPGKDDWVLVRRGDFVLLTYTVNAQGKLEDLVSVGDTTTGSLYAINKPGATAANSAAGVAALILVVGFFVLWVPIDLSFMTSLIVAVVLAVLAFVGSVKAFEPRRKLAPAEQGALSERHQTLEQKQMLSDKRRKAAGDLAEKEQAVSKLRQLLAKMQGVGSDLYQTRIERIMSAISLLERQAEIDRGLLLGYDRLVTMIEIEIESSSAAASLPVAVAEDLSRKLAELSAVEAQHRENEAQLAANEEVERLLKG